MNPLSGLEFVQCPVNTPADSLPINPHVFGDSTARQVDGEPSSSQVEVFRKAAPRISPWNVCNEDSVLWTQDTMYAVLDLNQRPSPVGSALGTGQTCLDIIWPAPLMAERAVILMPLVRVWMDPEVVHTVGILIKIVSGHNCGLDAEQLLA